MFQFSVRGDLGKVQKSLENLEKGTRDTVREFLVRTANHAAERSTENAPLWKNYLRPTTVPTPVVTQSTRMESGVKSYAPYAILMHEYQICYSSPGGPLDAVPGSRYGFGPKTRRLPRQPEGGPGGKFIARVLNFHAQRYLNNLATMMTMMLIRQ